MRAKKERCVENLNSIALKLPDYFAQSDRWIDGHAFIDLEYDLDKIYIYHRAFP